jgi:hypothetical protein
VDLRHRVVLTSPDLVAADRNARAGSGSGRVDDFAVEDDARWSTEGRELLRAVWRAASASGQPVLRAVTARLDEPKRSMLSDVGLLVASRWWAKELAPSATAVTAVSWGPITVGDVPGLLVPAPPVYDPGGPVCLLGDLEPERAIVAAEDAAAAGAVLAIVRRERAPGEVPETEPVLEAAGFHNPSEFRPGTPV